MRSVLIIVSTNHSDLLGITLPRNKKLFDKVLIATIKSDKDTQNICNLEDVRFVFCDDYLFQNGSAFNRGAVYNYIFRQFIYGDDLIILADSDIIFPDNFREILEKEAVDTEQFYGCQRWNIEKFEDFQKIENNPAELNRENYKLFRGFGFGFCQIFYSDSFIFSFLVQKTNFHPYPEFPTNHTGDYLFRNNWGEPIYHPDFNLNEHNEKEYNDYGSNLLQKLSCNVIHLGETGKNNSSRITEKFAETI